MKLRTKAILFFGTALLIIALGIFIHTEYVVGNVFKKQATSNLQIIAEQSEGAYLSFLGSLKVRALDWTSDSTLRDKAKTLLATAKGSPERARASREFSTYVKEKKMPFDKTIFLTSLLDRDGIVISSTDPRNIGINEKDEEVEGRKEHNFTETINSKFGEVFFGSIVFRGDKEPGPALNATARLFDFGKDGEPLPLDAVLLVYFSNVQQIAEVLGSGTSIYAGTPEQTERQTSRALLDNYKTSELYLVNNDRVMVTPSRTVKNITKKQSVDTLPVRECLENGKEINDEYDNYRGVRVLGSSMCFQKEGIVLVTEIQKDEIFAPLTMLIRSTEIGGVIAFVLGLLIIIIFIRRPLARINDIVLVAKRVAKGDLETQVEIKTKDEVGYLGTIFNDMISAIRNNQKELLVSKQEIEIKTHILEEDLREHEEQQKFLEQSKKATLNLLKDAWETKEKIKEEEAKDEAILESLGEGMITADNAGNVIIMNRAAEKMLGWAKEEIIGKSFTEMIPSLDEEGKLIPGDMRAISRAIATGTVTTSNNTKLTAKDGKLIPIAATVTPVILDGKTIGAVSVFRDVTKEMELEQTRRDLLSLASHQLRTPLSGTKWLIETLKKGIHGTLSKNQEEYLDEIYKINEKMTMLVHDMLGVLRMEGDETLARKERVSVKAVLDTLLETLGPAAKEKQIALKLPESDASVVDTDPVLLQNVLENILSNAINYSPSGNEVTVSIEKNPAEIIFIIKDSGIGIPKDEQARLFERFYRASNAKTFDTGGTGLGLYIASMLAKKIGAHILFESEEGKGSTFFVHVPYFSL